MSKEWWEYDQLPSGEPYDWSPAARGDSPWDNLDFHLDLGCGKLKKGRLGIDRYHSEEVDLLMDLNALVPISGECKEEDRRLPFPDNSIESIITHHFLEHLGDGFLPLMDECQRVLVPGGVFRIIVPLFPSHSAVADPDHKRYFLVDTFETFCGTREGDHWMDSFSVPYTNCRFEMVDQDFTARSANPSDWWMPQDARELRVALRKWA